MIPANLKCWQSLWADDSRTFDENLSLILRNLLFKGNILYVIFAAPQTRLQDKVSFHPKVAVSQTCVPSKSDCQKEMGCQPRVAASQKYVEDFIIHPKVAVSQKWLKARNRLPAKSSCQSNAAASQKGCQP